METAEDHAEIGSVSDHRSQTIRWLLGELTEDVTYGGPPDDETLPLVPVLVEFNERGLWTHFSQPGETDGEYSQRACVEGYCTEALGNHILGAAATTDLVVLALPAAMQSHLQIVISRSGPQEHTWAGGHDVFDISRFLSPAVVGELSTLWWVQVIDPVWGRNELLWDVVLTALRERRPRVLDASWPEPPPAGAVLAQN